jgi:hypothetical protein
MVLKLCSLFYFYFFGVVVCSLRIYTRSIYIVVEQGPGRGLMGDIFFLMNKILKNN